MSGMLEDIKATLHGVWQKRWLGLCVAWGVCVLGWLGVSLVPNGYESRARIFVQLYDPLATQVGINDNDRKAAVDRVRDSLTGTLHLEQVIRSTRLGEGITSRKQMDATVAGLAKAIQISSEQDNLFTISAKSSAMRFTDGENARLSRDIVQKLIDIFREENLNGGLGEMKQTLQFLDQQLANRQGELQAAEQRRLAFESQHPELAQGGMSLIQRMEQGRATLRELDADLAAAQSSVAAINAQMASMPQTLGAGGAVGGARGQLAQAQSDLAQMRARGLTENHPDVIAARNQIAALRQQAKSEGGAVVGGAPNPAYTSLESIRAERVANVQALQARRAAAEGDIARISSQQISNPELIQEAQNISRDYDVLKTQYDKMLTDRENLRLKGQVVSARGTARMEVLDPPVLPRAPVAPNRPLLLLVVLVAGIGAGIGAAFLASELQSSFSTSAKLERAVGLPVLGAISQVVSPVAMAERARKMRQFFAASAALGGVFALLLVMEFIQRGTVA
ncbi:chain-length determining protein [Novosphingobium umbonatum]|uniref:Chain-length determining protein n=2 Tax=Novosphingobium umbonatum TaxID=1908524 RepID=A0A3S2V500_9SPHN|nr:XrtA system polysaccharide chain length determinant [Novosphingobium umbonatum]RVU03624.1 chain-length determining protein [Novosphingobium umbonatum]